LCWEKEVKFGDAEKREKLLMLMGSVWLMMKVGGGRREGQRAGRWVLVAGRAARAEGY
jgi:hypothetical protein